MTPLPPVLEALGWMLVHFVWQGALIATGLALVRRGWWRAGPGQRYGLACAALFAMAAVPLVTFATTWSAATAAQQPTVAPNPVLDVLPLTVTGGRGPGFIGPFASRWMPWILVGWATGVVVLAGRVAIGWARLRRLVIESTVPVDAGWQRRASRLIELTGLSRPVRLLVSAKVACPVLVGCWRPVILLPLSAITGLPVCCRESAILHELVHVRRWDPLVHRLQLLVETVLFYHPGVWWVSRVIRDEREFCCDVAVVALTGDRIGYARALADLESLRMTASRQLLASTGGSLMSRVQQIVRNPVPRPAAAGSPWAAAALGLAVGMLLVAPAAAPNSAGEPGRGAAAPIVWMPDALIQWQPQFEEAAERHGVDADLLAIVTLLESGGNPEAVSPGGALGLMQIMPETALKIAGRRSIEEFNVEGLRDPGVNIDFGAWYLAEQLAVFGAGRSADDAVALAAAAYNGGPRQLRAHLQNGQPLSGEAQRYSRLVKELWLDRRAIASPAFERWWNSRGRKAFESPAPRD